MKSPQEAAKGVPQDSSVVGKEGEPGSSFSEGHSHLWAQAAGQGRQGTPGTACGLFQPPQPAQIKPFF